MVSAKRNARIELKADAKGMDAGLADARHRLRTFEREQTRSSAHAAKQAQRRAKADAKAQAKIFAGAHSGIRSGVGMAAGMLGVDSITGIASDALDFQRELDRFHILSGKSTKEMAELRQSILDVSTATNVGAGDILKAGAHYVDLSSDVAGSVKAMSTFARVAQATGSSVNDIATAAASMQDAMHLDPAQYEAVFSGLAAQGKAGAIGFKEMAGSVTDLLPLFQRFKGSIGADGILQFGAAFQVAKKNFGSAEKAGTGLESLMGSLAQHADKFENAGIKVFDVGKDGTKTFRNLHDIVVAIGKSKLAKDPTLLSKAFGRKEAESTFDALHKHAELYDQLIDAGKDFDTVNRDLATHLNDASGKLDRAWNAIKVSVAEAFTPGRIQAFADAIEDAATKIGPLVDGVGKIGDILGGINGAGKAIRGFMTGDNDNGNPFRKKIAGVALGGGNLDQMLSETPEGRERVKNAKGYDSAVQNILGGEVNEKSTPESIERAVLARYAVNAGASTAGNRYLAAQYGSGDEVSTAVDAAVQRMAAEMGKAAATDAARHAIAIVTAIKDLGQKISGLNFQISKDGIYDAQANSARHRYHK
jgi:TP901 family phage tail tape measure protein